MTELGRKVEVKYDKDTVNTMELIVHGESHTLANMVRDMILKNSSCTFCAYKIAHPSDDFVSIRVGAIENTPVRIMVIESLEVLSQNIEDLINQVIID